MLGDQSSPSDASSEHSDCQEPKDNIMNDRVYEEGDREAMLRGTQLKMGCTAYTHGGTTNQSKTTPKGVQ